MADVCRSQVRSMEPKNATIVTDGQFQFIANAVLGAVTLLLNSLSFLGILTSTTLPKRQKLLTCSMLTTDILVGFQVLAVRISTYTYDNTSLLCQVRLYSALILTFVTIFINVIMTLDRFLSLFIVLRYDHLVTCRVVMIMVICSWLVAIGCTAFFFSKGFRGQDKCLLGIPDSPNGFLFLGLTICISFLAIIMMYVYIASVTKRHIRQIAATMVGDFSIVTSTRRYLTKSERRTNVTVGIISVLFGISYCPIGIFCVYSVLSGSAYIQNQQLVFNVLITCFMINSLMNPITYIWRLGHCRKQLINRILCRTEVTVTFVS